MDPRALLRLTRPGNALVSGAAVAVGAFLAGAPPWPAVRIVAGMVAAVAFAAAGNVRNDVVDVEVDRRAHPTRPLVTGAVSLRAARLTAGALYAVAFAAGLVVGAWGLVLVLVAFPVMELYERRWKREGLPGNVAVAALTAAPFLLGALAVAAAPSAGSISGAVDAAEVLSGFVAGFGALPAFGPAVLAVAGLAALVTAGREVLKDIEDADADAAHRRTLPMRIGTKRAALVAAAFLVLAVVLSPLPWLLETVLGWAYLPAIAGADACFLAAAAVGARRPSRGQRLAKLGMVAALVALVVGRVQGGVAF